MFSKKNKKIIPSLVLPFVICVFIFLASPNKVNGGWPVWDPGNAALKAIGNVSEAANAASNKSLAIKETILDGIAFIVINNMIEQIADATVDWINSGFDGGPGFITNLDDFLTETADRTIGQIIEGSQLAFLCSPFSLDIKIALTLQLGGERRAHCTLSDVFNNIGSALDDLGNDWAWDKWYNVTQPQNNIYGAYISAYYNAKLKIQNEADKAISKSDWAKGFLEFKDCEADHEEMECENVMEEGECETYTVPGECTTKTPGGLIQDTLGDTLMIGNKRLVIADEINEIVGALLNQLFKAVLGGIAGGGGLLNSDPSSEYGFSEVPAETTEKMKEYILEAIAIEENYKSWKDKSIADVSLAEQYLLALIECWKDNKNTDEAEKQLQIGWAEGVLNSTITPLKNRLEAESLLAGTNITDLNDLLTKIENAENDKGEIDALVLNDIWGEFKALNLHSIEDPFLAEQEYHEVDGSGGIKAQMGGIITQATLRAEKCQGAFIPPSYTPSAPNCTITLSQTNISSGTSVTLAWTSSNAKTGSIDGVGEVPTGELGGWTTTVTPIMTTTYTGIVTGAGGTNTCQSETVTVTSE